MTGGRVVIILQPITQSTNHLSNLEQTQAASVQDYGDMNRESYVYSVYVQVAARMKM